MCCDSQGRLNYVFKLVVVIDENVSNEIASHFNSVVQFWCAWNNSQKSIPIFVVDFVAFYDIAHFLHNDVTFNEVEVRSMATN